MKKMLKSIISVILAMLICMGPVTAFARDAEKKVIEWDFGWWIEEYVYAGEIKEGTTKIIYDEELPLRYYDFKAENAGYYALSFNPELIDAIVPEEYENDFASYEKFLFYSTENGVRTKVTRLEKGDTVIGIDFYSYEEATESDIAAAELTLEYLGEDIADITIPEKQLKDLVIDYDIYCRGKKGGIYSDITISFPLGKSFTLKEIETPIKCEKFQEGENTITIEFDTYSKNFTVTAYPVSYYVKDAQLSNYEEYAKVSVDYSGSEFVKNINGETVTFTFNDGSSYNSPITYNEGVVILPNGKEYYVSLEYLYEEDENGNEGYVLAIYAAGDYVTKYPCSEESASFSQNFEFLTQSNSEAFLIFLEYLSYAMEYLTYISDNFFAFIKYYLFNGI